MQSEPCSHYNALPGTGFVGDKIFGSHLPQTMGGYRHISKISNKYISSGQSAEDVHLKDTMMYVTVNKPLKATETKLSDKN